MTKGDSLDRHREEIDSIDLELMTLLNRRAGCAVAIGEFKKENGLPIYVPEREAKVIENVTKKNQGPLPDAALGHLFREIFSEMKKLEQ